MSVGCRWFGPACVVCACMHVGACVHVYVDIRYRGVNISSPVHGLSQKFVPGGQFGHPPSTTVVDHQREWCFGLLPCREWVVVAGGEMYHYWHNYEPLTCGMNIVLTYLWHIMEARFDARHYLSLLFCSVNADRSLSTWRADGSLWWGDGFLTGLTGWRVYVVGWRVSMTSWRISDGPTGLYDCLTG